MHGRRGGFSLLEVLLAMAILLGAIVVLGELARTGRQNAAAARDWTRAEMIAETITNEIALGLRPAEEVEDVVLDEFPGWRYTTVLSPTDEPALVSLEVTVTQDLPEEKRPLRYTLGQWIRRPVETSPGF